VLKLEEDHTDCDKPVRLLIYDPGLTQAEREMLGGEARNGANVIRVFTNVPEPDPPR